MQHATASARLTTDVSEYVENMRKLPGITDRELKAAALRYASHLQKMEAANSKFKMQTREEIGDSVEEFSKVTDVVGKMPSVLNGAFGDALGPVGDFGDLMKMMGPWGAAAAVGLGLAGAAVVSVLTDLDRFRDNMDDLQDEHILSPQAIEGIKLASASMTTLGNRTEDFQVKIAAEAAPAILNFVKGSVYAFSYLSTFAGEMFGDVAEGGAAMWDALTKRDFRFVRSELRDLVDVTGELEIATATAQVAVSDFIADTSAESTRATYEYVQSQTAEARAAAERAAAERKRIQERRQAAEHKIVDQLREAELKLLPVSDRIYAQAEARIEQVRELAEVSGDLADAERLIALIRADAVNADAAQQRETRARREQEEIEAATAAAEAASPAISAAFDALDEDLGASTMTARGLKEQIAALYEDLEGFIAEGSKASQEQIDETLDKIAELEDQLRRQQISTVSSVFSSTQSIVGSIGSIAEARARHIAGVYGEQSAAAKQAELEAWQTQKAAGYAQAVLSLPIAIAQAWELPWPANLAAIAAAGLGVGAQIAAIESSPPPSLHGGGLADERDYRLKRDELVVSAPQVSRAGGVDSVRARIETPASSGPTHVSIDFGDHRVVQSMQRQLERVRRDPWLGMAA